MRYQRSACHRENMEALNDCFDFGRNQAVHIHSARIATRTRGTLAWQAPITATELLCTSGLRQFKINNTGFLSWRISISCVKSERTSSSNCFVLSRLCIHEEGSDHFRAVCQHCTNSCEFSLMLLYYG